MQACYATIHQIVSELVVADNFIIALYDEARQLMSTPYVVDPLNPIRESPQEWLSLDKAAIAYVLRTGRPVDQAVIEELIVQGVIDLVGNKIRELVQTDSVAVALLDRDTNLIHPHYMLIADEQRLDAPTSPLGAEDSVFSMVILSSQSIVWDSYQEASAAGFTWSFEEQPLESYVVVPHTIGGEAIGCLGLSNREQNAFDEGDVRLPSISPARSGVTLRSNSTSTRFCSACSLSSSGLS